MRWDVSRNCMMPDILLWEWICFCRQIVWRRWVWNRTAPDKHRSRRRACRSLFPSANRKALRQGIWYVPTRGVSCIPIRSRIFRRNWFPRYCRAGRGSWPVTMFFLWCFLPADRQCLSPPSRFDNRCWVGSFLFLLDMHPTNRRFSSSDAKWVFCW